MYVDPQPTPAAAHNNTLNTNGVAGFNGGTSKARDAFRRRRRRMSRRQRLSRPQGASRDHTVREHGAEDCLTALKTASSAGFLREF